MESLSNRQYYILYIVALLIVIGYLSVTLFIYPFADDFTYALKGQQDDFIRTVLNERQIWNGRYLSNFLVIGHPLNWGGLVSYRIMAASLIVFSIVGLYCGCRILNIKRAGLLALLIFVVLVSSLPNTSEAFYWFCGAWTYIPAAILLFLEFVILFKRKAEVKLWVLIPIFLIGSGFNELFSLISVLLILLKFTEVKNFRIAVLFVLQIFLFYYVFTAPGNEYRASLFKGNYDFFNTLKLTGMYTLRFIGEWLLNPLIYLIFIVIIKADFKSLKISILKKPIYVLLLLILPTIIACAGPIWSTGILGQHRTANMACFLFFTFLFLAILSNKEKFKFIDKWGFKWGFVIMIFAMLFWKNNFFLLEDLTSGELSRFEKKLEERVDILENCNEEFCNVPALIDQPHTFQVYRLDNNPEHWKNKSYQLYYKSGKVIPILHR